MNIIVTGCTGLVGAEVLRQAILNPEIHRVTAISRSPIPITGSKIEQILHRDFLNYTSIAAQLPNHDACLWCLGVSQNAVPQEEYIRITLDYTVAGAQALLAANPRLTFCFLSGEGSDPTEKSRFLFARIKGRAETALDRMPFERLHHFRPGYIHPTHPRAKRLLIERIAVPLMPLVTAISPAFAQTSEQVAKAMLQVAKTGYPERVILAGAVPKLAAEP